MYISLYIYIYIYIYMTVYDRLGRERWRRPGCRTRPFRHAPALAGESFSFSSIIIIIITTTTTVTKYHCCPY